MPVISFRRRRTRTAILVASVAGLLILGVSGLNAALVPASMYSGWVLLVLIFGLALFNVRKKLSPVPLGAAATWVQVHIYAGFLSVLLFLLHIGFRRPDGGLELALALVYALVAATGFIGLLLSRTIPTLLGRRGEEVIFERIPVHCRALREQAQTIVLEAASAGDSTAITDFYTHRLADFFEGPRNAWRHLFRSSRPRHAMLASLRALDRYLDDNERALRKRLEELVLAKDNLDFHYANQAALKYWLFVHIPLTYSLLVLCLLHAFVVYIFSGAGG